MTTCTVCSQQFNKKESKHTYYTKDVELCDKCLAFRLPSNMRGVLFITVARRGENIVAMCRRKV